MGWIVHDAIIVTSWDSKKLNEAHSVAVGLMPHVSGIVHSGINGYASFLIAPDGSKEGWAESDTGDAARAAFLEWLNTQAYEDGSNSLTYAAVRYGEISSTVRSNETTQ